jgi:uncharacterized membrane protein YdjX (TVP38/TMEM64 family)
MGGLLFGQWVGTMLVITAATTGATILFVGLQLATREWLKKKSGQWIKKMQHGFKKNATYYLLTLRLIPLFPFFAVNIVAAFFKISVSLFFWTTLIGIIPASFVYVSMGVSLHKIMQTSHITPTIIMQPEILLSLSGLGILTLLPVWYKAVYGKKRGQRKS